MVSNEPRGRIKDRKSIFFFVKTEYSWFVLILGALQELSGNKTALRWKNLFKTE